MAGPLDKGRRGLDQRPPPADSPGGCVLMSGGRRSQGPVDRSGWFAPNRHPSAGIGIHRARDREPGTSGAGTAWWHRPTSCVRPPRRQRRQCYAASPNRTFDRNSRSAAGAAGTGEDREARAMRIYAPAGTVETLDRLLENPQVAAALVAHHVLPEREAQTLPFPGWLDKRLVRALHSRGIEKLYTHQAESLEALKQGKDIVVVTPTASGKSLCYNLPVLQAVAEDPSARALYLFPTKALSQDQLAAFRELASRAEIDVAAGVYDGDTPGPIRTDPAQRRPGRGHQPGHAPLGDPAPSHQVVPALRTAALHRHRRGAHVPRHLRQPRRQRAAPPPATLRALRQQAADHAAARRPSGTPQSLAETLTGRPMTVIDRNGAPSGREARRRPQPAGHRRAGRHPTRAARPRPSSGARLPARRAADDRLRQARVSVELLLTGLREAFREGRGPLQRIRGYRGGYLPTERRAIEAGLRTGDVLGVVSHQRAGAGHRHRPAGRGDPGRLPGHHRRQLAADGSVGAAARGDRWRSSCAGAGAGRPVRRRRIPSTCSTRRPRRRASIRPTCTSCSATSGRPLSSCRSSPAIRLAGRSDGRPAGVPRRGGPRPPGRRRALVLGVARTSRRRRSRCASARQENVVIIDTTGHPTADRDRRGRPVRRPVLVHDKRDLPARVAPVPRGAARLGASARRTSRRSTSTTTPRRCWP